MQAVLAEAEGPLQRAADDSPSPSAFSVRPRKGMRRRSTRGPRYDSSVRAAVVTGYAPRTVTSSSGSAARVITQPRPRRHRCGSVRWTTSAAVLGRGRPHTQAAVVPGHRDTEAAPVGELGLAVRVEVQHAHDPPARFGHE